MDFNATEILAIAIIAAIGYEIQCRLGLWAVSAPTQEQADREARRYFIQYYEDEEYEDK